MKILRLIYKAVTFVIRAFFAAVVGMWVYVPVSELAYAERGYAALGGELIVALIPAMVVFVGLECFFDYASPFPQDKKIRWRWF